MRRQFISFAVVSIVGVLVISWIMSPLALWAFAGLGPVLFIGFRDYFQTKHTIRRNFPIFGNFRYVFEAIRPEINQYFVESNTDGVPFSREERSIVYQR